MDAAKELLGTDSSISTVTYLKKGVGMVIWRGVGPLFEVLNENGDRKSSYY